MILFRPDLHLDIVQRPLHLLRPEHMMAQLFFFAFFTFSWTFLSAVF
jgi:hypothetical protein